MYFRAMFYLQILGLIIFNSCIKQPSSDLNDDRLQWNLKGNVESLSEITYSTSGKYVTTISFNKAGFVSEQVSYNPDHSLIRRWVYKYDEQNRKLTRDCYVQKDSLSYTMYYYYNQQGKIANTKTIRSNGVLGSQKIYQYDNNQNVTKESVLGENATLENSILHQYNEKNELTKETYIDSALHRDWKQIYKYNSKGLKEEILYLSMKDSLVKKTKYTYLENKKIDQTFVYNAENELLSTTTYKYDRQGNTIEILELLPDNKTPKKQVFQYKYDKRGNWTFLSQSANDVQENIMTRKVEYF
jgi:hypothetical protein